VLANQGLVDAYVANSQQGKAVEYLNGLRDKLLAAAAAAPTAATAAGSSSSSSSGVSSSENAAATAAVMPGAGDEAAAGRSSSSGSEQGAAGDASQGGPSNESVAMDPVGVQLLLGESVQSHDVVQGSKVLWCRSS
jgi:hypothetical protein